MSDALPRGHLLDPVPGDLPEELVETLATGAGPMRIERIVSRGHRSAEGFWYDQDRAEWVALLAGSATLRLDGPEGELVSLVPGDWIHLSAHRKHRVETTDPGTDTVWLAVFFGE